MIRVVGTGTPLEPTIAVPQTRLDTGPTRSLGELCVAADWALSDGDLDALGEIVRRIADAVPDPLHCDLIELADACTHDPARAWNAWPPLRDRVFGVLPP
jgi:hypothetical protein